MPSQEKCMLAGDDLWSSKMCKETYFAVTFFARHIINDIQLSKVVKIRLMCEVSQVLLCMSPNTFNWFGIWCVDHTCMNF